MDVVAVAVALLALAVALAALLRPRSRRGEPEVIAIAESPQAIREGLATALRHVSVVRYDAFGDVSGRQSFTAAILDDHGDGLVITSLHARTESRTYLKGVNAGAGSDLSPEEREAVAHAAGATQ